MFTAPIVLVFVLRRWIASASSHHLGVAEKFARKARRFSHLAISLQSRFDLKRGQWLRPLLWLRLRSYGFPDAARA